MKFSAFWNAIQKVPALFICASFKINPPILFALSIRSIQLLLIEQSRNCPSAIWYSCHALVLIYSCIKVLICQSKKRHNFLPVLCYFAQIFVIFFVCFSVFTNVNYFFFLIPLDFCEKARKISLTNWNIHV